MRRPLETILSLPRVRLVNKVPLVETEELIELYIDKRRYRGVLVRHATKVTEGAYIEFVRDDESLTSIIDEINKEDFFVTRKARAAIRELVTGIYGDGIIFKQFEAKIKPLFTDSAELEEITKITDRVADSTKEHSLDVARLVGVSIATP